MQVDRLRKVTALERVFERLDVTGEGGRVQPQLGRAEEQVVFVEVAAEGVATLS